MDLLSENLQLKEQIRMLEDERKMLWDDIFKKNTEISALTMKLDKAYSVITRKC